MRECCSLVGSMRRTSNFFSQPSLPLSRSLLYFLSLRAAEFNDKRLSIKTNHRTDTITAGDQNGYTQCPPLTRGYTTHLNCSSTGPTRLGLGTVHRFHTEFNMSNTSAAYDDRERRTRTIRPTPTGESTFYARDKLRGRPTGNGTDDRPAHRVPYSGPTLTSRILLLSTRRRLR